MLFYPFIIIIIPLYSLSSHKGVLKAPLPFEGDASVVDV